MSIIRKLQSGSAGSVLTLCALATNYPILICIMCYLFWLSGPASGCFTGGGWSIQIDCSQTVRRVYWGLMGMNSQYLKIYNVQCSFPVPSVPERNVRVPWRDLIWWTSAPAWLSTGPPSEGHKTGSIENGQSEGHQRGICPVCCRMNKLLMPTHLQTWPRSHRKVWNKEEIYCSDVQWIFTAVCFVQTENWSYTRT